MINGIDAHYYLAKDYERALAFYRDALQLEPTTDFGGGVEFVLPDGTAFGLASMPNGEWHAGGGTTVSDVMDYPTCVTVWCYDTEGNNFALHRLKAKE